MVSRQYVQNDPGLAMSYTPMTFVAMAKTQSPSTTGSQFFIVYKDIDQLDPSYTVLGTVTQGLDIVKKVAADGVIPADPSNPGDGTRRTRSANARRPNPLP